MKKELIFIGLGRMGSAMTARLIEHGYTVHGFDVAEKARENAKENGVKVYQSIADAIRTQSERKIIWLMVPAQFVDNTLHDVYPHLQMNDVIIDGGNSFFSDTKERATAATAQGFHYVDCGTSGGVNGARHGASLMVGGESKIIESIEDVFLTLATKGGYGHVGKSGAGHFVKMVHNGIEYGMMGAIAEGISFIEKHQTEMDLKTLEVFKPYKNGSIISSNLMSWMAEAYQQEGYLEQIAGKVPQGETETEMEYIVAQNQSPVLQAALQQRKNTRNNPTRTGTFISAMRNVFGGHSTLKK